MGLLSEGYLWHTEYLMAQESELCDYERPGVGTVHSVPMVVGRYDHEVQGTESGVGIKTEVWRFKFRRSALDNVLDPPRPLHGDKIHRTVDKSYEFRVVELGGEPAFRDYDRDKLLIVVNTTQSGVI